MKRILYVTAIAILALSLPACAGGGSATPSDSSIDSVKDAADPMVLATNEFNSATQNLSDAKVMLSDLIPEAELLLESVTAEDVADASVLENLSSALERAAGVAEISVPSIKSEVEEVQLQVQDVQKQADDIWNIYSNMDSAVASVKMSQQTLLDNRLKESVSLGENHVGHVTNFNGYTAEYTVSTTGWIKASDAELLQLAWENITGDGSMVPSISQFHSKANDGFTEANAAVAFGKLSLRNTTQDFDITEESPVTFTLSPGMSWSYEKLFSSISTPKMYIKYAEPKIVDFGNSIADISMYPLMKSNSWGPVAFMLVYPNAITPNDPEGTAFNDSPLIFSTAYNNRSGENISIEIKTSW